MKHFVDDRGYHQGFSPEKPSTLIRLKRRCDWIVNAMGDAINRDTTDILEIGCGIGIVASWIAQKTAGSVLGSDICESFIDEARRRFSSPNLEYLAFDFNRPDLLRGRQFDFIVGNGILHHLYYNLDDVFEGFKKLMKPGGKLIFMEPNIINPYCALIFNIPFLRRKAKLEPDEMAFSKSFIYRKLQEHAYENVEVLYRDFLLPGIPMFLVKPSIFIGNIVEKIPLLRVMSQSLFITASLSS